VRAQTHVSILNPVLRAMSGLRRACFCAFHVPLIVLLAPGAGFRSRVDSVEQPSLAAGTPHGVAGPPVLVAPGRWPMATAPVAELPPEMYKMHFMDGEQVWALAPNRNGMSTHGQRHMLMPLPQRYHDGLRVFADPRCLRPGQPAPVLLQSTDSAPESAARLAGAQRVVPRSVQSRPRLVAAPGQSAAPPPVAVHQAVPHVPQLGAVSHAPPTGGLVSAVGAGVHFVANTSITVMDHLDAAVGAGAIGWNAAGQHLPGLGVADNPIGATDWVTVYMQYHNYTPSQVTQMSTTLTQVGVGVGVVGVGLTLYEIRKENRAINEIREASPDVAREVDDRRQEWWDALKKGELPDLDELDLDDAEEKEVAILEYKEESVLINKLSLVPSAGGIAAGVGTLAAGATAPAWAPPLAATCAVVGGSLGIYKIFLRDDPEADETWAQWRARQKQEAWRAISMASSLAEEEAAAGPIVVDGDGTTTTSDPSKADLIIADDVGGGGFKGTLRAAMQSDEAGDKAYTGLQGLLSEVREQGQAGEHAESNLYEAVSWASLLMTAASIRNVVCGVFLMLEVDLHAFPSEWQFTGGTPDGQPEIRTITFRNLGAPYDDEPFDVQGMYIDGLLRLESTTIDGYTAHNGPAFMPVAMFPPLFNPEAYLAQMRKTLSGAMTNSIVADLAFLRDGAAAPYPIVKRYDLSSMAVELDFGALGQDRDQTLRGLVGVAKNMMLGPSWES